MSRITVYMKDGTTKDFPDQGASGGSYCNSIKYEGVFAVIKNAHGEVTAIPAENIEHINHESSRR